MIKEYTDWSNLYKVRIRNSMKQMEKHDIVKLLLVMKLLEKHKRERAKIRIYTEFSVLDNRICDVYYENFRTKEAYAFEIQNHNSKEWLEKVTKDYKNWDASFMNTSDLIIINLKELSNDLDELSKQIEEYVV